MDRIMELSFNTIEPFDNFKLKETICNKILSTATNMIEASNLGFVSSSDSFCGLQILAMIQHSLDNLNVLTNEEKNNILILYNKYRPVKKRSNLSLHQ